MPLQLTTASGTHAHTNNTNEQTVFTYTPTQPVAIVGIWLDLVNLTQNCTIRLKYPVDGTNTRTFHTISWDTGMDDGALIEGNIPLAASGTLTVTLQSTALEGASRDISYQYIRDGVGAGATSFVYTLTSSVDGSVISDATVWVTSDAAGNNLLGSGTTDSNGQVTFFLTSGATVYVWRAKAGWNFPTNPDVETV